MTLVASIATGQRNEKALVCESSENQSVTLAMKAYWIMLIIEKLSAVTVKDIVLGPKIFISTPHYRTYIYIFNNLNIIVSTSIMFPLL